MLMTPSIRRLSSFVLVLATAGTLGLAGCAAKYNNAAGITAQPAQILWNTTGPAQTAPTPTVPTTGDPNPPLPAPNAVTTIGALYDTTPLSSAELNAVANTPGTFVYTPAAGTFLTPGTQTLSVTFTPNDTTNYKVTTVTAQIQVLDITDPAQQAALIPEPVQIISGGYVDGLYFHPLQKDLRYAKTDVGGAYRWDQLTYPTPPPPTQLTQPKDSGGVKMQYGHWTPLLDFVGRANGGDQGVESLALDPSDPKRLYLATGLNYNNDPGQQNHFYLSDDQGNTFTQVNAPFPINGNDNGRDAGERMAVDPNLGTTIYYGTRTAGLWKSLDRGMTWSQVTSFPVTGKTAGAGVVFVTFAATSGASGTATPVIYVGVSDYNYYNTDGSNNGSPVYSAIYRSVDSGATWQAVPGQPTTKPNPNGSGPANYNLTPIHGVFGPDETSDSLGSMYITYFSDEGPGDTAPGIGAIYQYTPTVGTPGGAGSWTEITPNDVRTGADDGGYAGLSLDAERPGVIMATTMDDYDNKDDVVRSQDYGQTWVSIKHGLGAPNYVDYSPWLTFQSGSNSGTTTQGGNWYSALAIDPFNSDHVIYGSGQTLYDSTDMQKADTGKQPSFNVGAYGAALGGTKDVQGGASIEETVVLGLAAPPSGSPLISAVGDLGTFVHPTLDASPTFGSDFNPQFTTGTGVDYAQNNPLMLVRVGSGSNGTDSYYVPVAGTTAKCGSNTNPQNNSNCVQVTVPQLFAYSPTQGVKGNDWTPIDTLNDAPSTGVTSATKFSAGGGTVAIAPDSSAIVWATYDFPPACTADLGVTWTPAINGIIGAQVISDRVNPSKFYQYDPASGELLLGIATIGPGASSSFQCTLTFTVQSTLPANSSGQIAASFGAEGDIWLAVNNSSSAEANGLYHSTDSGKTLTKVDSLTSAYAVGLGAPATTSAVAAYSMPAIYAVADGATGYGFYRSIDDGATWVNVSNANHLLGTVNSIVGDQNIFGRYYIGTGGRGIGYVDSN
jgi:xyloglucan-specific exo-beta-1,4-glucanase